MDVRAEVTRPEKVLRMAAVGPLLGSSGLEQFLLGLKGGLSVSDSGDRVNLFTYEQVCVKQGSHMLAYFQL